MPLRERVLEAVKKNPGLSATQLSKLLGEDNSGSTSSALYKMVQDNELYRVQGRGPRGGYTYYEKCPYPSRFDRL